MHDDFNDLLMALSEDDRARVAARLSRQDLAKGAMLHDPGNPIDYCYFPSGAAVASYRVVLADGLAVETATVGREGALGGVVSHGPIPAFARSSVLQGGTFLRIALRDLDQLKQGIPAVERLFDRYADCFMAQVLQSTACDAAHTIEQRVARWLIAATWRSGSNKLVMTQEQMGELLGIGRTYASRVLQRFKDNDLIEIRRGRLIVIDQDAVRSAACGCNAAIASHYATVLGGIYPE
ncbi:MAG: Crp/Fnr family transcriptional regulator [Proteobacteria bacterium]|nr:Crp/Fnr family transcriptional regulator [Pseudomonadota bacterium]MDE2411455.1 Crp/Fnr family transcriptional regulator [Sphingomonadales bacterium]